MGNEPADGGDGNTIDGLVEKAHESTRERHGIGGGDANGGVSEKAWVPYEGPQGGEGWKNIDSGRVEYSDDPPGNAMDEDDVRNEAATEMVEDAFLDESAMRSFAEDQGIDVSDADTELDLAQTISDDADLNVLANYLGGESPEQVAEVVHDQGVKTTGINDALETAQSAGADADDIEEAVEAIAGEYDLDPDNEMEVSAYLDRNEDARQDLLKEAVPEPSSGNEGPDDGGAEGGKGAGGDGGGGESGLPDDAEQVFEERFGMVDRQMLDEFEIQFEEGDNPHDVAQSVADDLEPMYEPQREKAVSEFHDRLEGNEQSRDGGVSEKQWVPYTGPEGGEGWQNIETGDIEYTDDPPGNTPDPGDISDEDLEQLAESEGVDASPDDIRAALEEELAEREDGGDAEDGGTAIDRADSFEEYVEEVRAGGDTSTSDEQLAEIYEEETGESVDPSDAPEGPATLAGQEVPEAGEEVTTDELRDLAGDLLDPGTARSAGGPMGSTDEEIEELLDINDEMTTGDMSGEEYDRELAEWAENNLGVDVVNGGGDAGPSGVSGMDEDEIRSELEAQGIAGMTADEVAFQLSRADDPGEQDVREAIETLQPDMPGNEQEVDTISSVLDLPRDDTGLSGDGSPTGQGGLEGNEQGRDGGPGSPGLSREAAAMDDAGRNDATNATIGLYGSTAGVDPSFDGPPEVEDAIDRVFDEGMGPEEAYEEVASAVPEEDRREFDEAFQREVMDSQAAESLTDELSQSRAESLYEDITGERVPNRTPEKKVASDLASELPIEAMRAAAEGNPGPAVDAAEQMASGASEQETAAEILNDIQGGGGSGGGTNNAAAETALQDAGVPFDYTDDGISASIPGRGIEGDTIDALQDAGYSVEGTELADDGSVRANLSADADATDASSQDKDNAAAETALQDAGIPFDYTTAEDYEGSAISARGRPDPETVEEMRQAGFEPSGVTDDGNMIFDPAGEEAGGGAGSPEPGTDEYDSAVERLMEEEGMTEEEAFAVLSDDESEEGVDQNMDTAQKAASEFRSRVGF